MLKMKGILLKDFIENDYVINLIRTNYNIKIIFNNYKDFDFYKIICDNIKIFKNYGIGFYLKGQRIHFIESKDISLSYINNNEPIYKILFEKDRILEFKFIKNEYNNKFQINDIVFNLAFKISNNNLSQIIDLYDFYYEKGNIDITKKIFLDSLCKDFKFKIIDILDYDIYLLEHCGLYNITKKYKKIITQEQNLLKIDDNFYKSLL